MATVVINQFVRVDGDQFFIKGTVDGNDHMMLIRGRYINPADNPGTQIAELFANDYYLIRNAVAQNLQGRTYQFRVLDNRTATVVFSSTLSQVWAEVGYGMLEITGTVNGVSGVKTLVRTAEFLQTAYSGGRGKDSVIDYVCRRLYQVYMDELQGFGQYTNTFSNISTTSSSTTTTSTTTTTTTT